MNYVYLIALLGCLGLPSVRSHVAVEVVIGGNSQRAERDMNAAEELNKRKAIDASGIWKDGIVPYEFSTAVGALDECADYTDTCSARLAAGQCDDYPAYMFEWCKKTCNFCGQSMGQRIETAMLDFETFTCLKFRPKEDGDEDYIHFKRVNGGCYSEGIGTDGGEHRVNIQSNVNGAGCDFQHIIIHEIGHALGLYHEQSRPDRDQYITINIDNIISSKVHNFRIGEDGSIETHGVPYDYYSIMHYKPNAFSSNGEPTITTKNKKFQDIIGTTRILSLLDIAILNKMYSCEKKYYRIHNPVTKKAVTKVDGSLKVQTEDVLTTDTDRQLWFLDNKYIRNKASPNEVLAVKYKKRKKIGVLQMQTLVAKGSKKQTWELLPSELQSDLKQLLLTQGDNDKALATAGDGGDKQFWVLQLAS